MDNFVEFTPIEKNIKEDALNYYNENGIDLPDHPAIRDYFSLSQDDKNIDMNFYAGKVSGKKSKLLTKKPVKQNPPRFSAFPNKPSEESQWPMKDSTVETILNKSKVNTKEKENFIKELAKLNLSDVDADYAVKLAEHESSFRPYVTNQLGYFGYYQFGDSAMKDVGFTKEDMKNPLNQHIAAIRYKNKNLEPFRDFIGKTVKGIKLTENNLAAAAHLAGRTGLRDWLNGTKNSSFSKRGFIDANGTHITKYLKEF